MANVHVFLLVEALTMGNPQRDNLFAAMRAITSQSNTQPAYINHDRERLDGDAIIVSALFDDGDIGLEQIHEHIGGIFAELPANIGQLVDTENVYGLEGVYSFPSGIVNRSRYIIFGHDGVFPSWEQSRQSMLSYLSDHDTAWEVET